MKHILTVFEPRWHGFARWELNEIEYDRNGIFAQLWPRWHGWVRREPEAESKVQEFPAIIKTRRTAKRLAQDMA